MTLSAIGAANDLLRAVIAHDINWQGSKDDAPRALSALDDGRLFVRKVKESEMRGIEKLSSVERTTPAMSEALPDLPMPETVMVRLIGICMVTLARNLEPAFRSSGFTGNSFYVMCLLMASPDGRASPSELSELLGTSRANVTKILDALMADGYVSRSAEGRDGRRQIVRITAAGIRAANKAVPTLSGPLKRAFSGLSADEFTQLGNLLRKSIASFDLNASLFAAKGDIDAR